MWTRTRYTQPPPPSFNLWKDPAVPFCFTPQWALSLYPLFSWKGTFLVFLLFSSTHLHDSYFIHIWFSSCLINILHNVRIFILHTVLLTHFLLCQYFNSYSPLFSTCCSLHMFFPPFTSFSLFCHVILYWSWHLQWVWPTQFPTRSFSLL